MQLPCAMTATELALQAIGGSTQPLTSTADRILRLWFLTSCRERAIEDEDTRKSATGPAPAAVVGQSVADALAVDLPSLP
jgi:hypothetical protein